MNLTLTEDLGYAIAVTEGPIDETASDPLREQVHPLFADRGTQLIMDLSDSKWINSEGLASLVRLVTDANTHGCRVVLCAMTPFVREVLHVTRLETFFEVADSREQAAELMTAAKPRMTSSKS